MLQFNVLGFPVTVQPFFWLITALLAIRGNMPEDGNGWIDLALWVITIFVSILVHELGHALALRKLGHYSEIELHGCGGSTFYHASLSRGQGIFVSAAGPFAGFLLAGMALLLRIFVHTEYAAVNTLIDSFLFINIFWTLLNLLPVLPLDGGHIFRDILGPQRLQVACMVGGVVAVAVAGLALMGQMIFTAFLFGYFAWVNFTNGVAEGGVTRR